MVRSSISFDWVGIVWKFRRIRESEQRGPDQLRTWFWGFRVLRVVEVWNSFCVNERAEFFVCIFLVRLAAAGRSYWLASQAAWIPTGLLRTEEEERCPRGSQTRGLRAEGTRYPFQSHFNLILGIPAYRKKTQLILISSVFLRLLAELLRHVGVIRFVYHVLQILLIRFT